MILPWKRNRKKKIKKIVEFPTVNDIMTRRVITLKPEDSINTAIKKLRDNGIRGAPVVDGNGRIVGMVHESDIMDWINEDIKAKNHEEFMKILREKGKEKVSKIMVKKPVVIFPEKKLEEAAALMYKSGVDRLPVIKNGKLVGIVSRDDIIGGLTSSHVATQAKSENVSTAIDKVIKEVAKHPDGIDMNELSDITGYSIETLEKVANILESHGLISIEYPLTGGKILKKK